MKIVVLNGSPKGEFSVTMQYVLYIRKKFPGHMYEIHDVAAEIKKLERDPAAFDRVIASVRSADLVLFSFPLYYLVVASQYKRFIELVFERKASDAYAGKYAASISTSIHFFDQTAHAYIHEICDDLGMKYLGAYSAEMQDLLKEEEQTRLVSFAALTFSAVEERLPVQPANAPVVRSSFAYRPGTGPEPLEARTKKIVILTDDDGSAPNLAAMTTRLSERFSGSAQLVNLRDLDIRGGCLGCCRCAYDNTCVYTDSYVDFFQNTLMPADIIIMAGSVHDRYLSSVWKQFFDRSFFKGHTPVFAGKQIAFVIAGPFRQLPALREALTAWADNGESHLQFLTDEVVDSASLDALLDSLAVRLLRCAERKYIPPRTFYAVGGHKLFRDSIYGRMRFVFQADYRYYRRHGLIDFPQGDLKTRLMNAVMIPLTRIPGFRKKVFNDMKLHMVEPFRSVIEKA